MAHETPYRELNALVSPVPGATTLLADHEVPFQVSAKASWPAFPTAMQNVAEVQDTPARLSGAVLLEESTELEVAQEVPFQICTSGPLEVLEYTFPTDTQKVATGHDTALRYASGVEEVGVVITVAVVDAPAGARPGNPETRRLASIAKVPEAAMSARRRPEPAKWVGADLLPPEVGSINAA